MSKGPESARGIGLVILFPLAIVSNGLVPTQHIRSEPWEFKTGPSCETVTVIAYWTPGLRDFCGTCA